MQTIDRKPGARPLPQLGGEEYLDTLEALAVEIDRAMQAIVSRKLPVLEDSVSRQQAACALLSATPRHACSPVPQNEAADSELAGRITEATATLLRLNRHYSALLQHSRDTVRLFAGVFQPYPGSAHAAPAYAASCGSAPPYSGSAYAASAHSGSAAQAATLCGNPHTWSCEL